jgi:serine/threonine-protein kinase HipA
MPCGGRYTSSLLRWAGSCGAKKEAKIARISKEDSWILAPAYDLLNVAIVNPEDTEELALTLEGKKKKIQWDQFERLGLSLGLNQKQLTSLSKRFIKNKKLALKWIDNSFLSEEYKEKYKEVLNNRYHILFRS